MAYLALDIGAGSGRAIVGQFVRNKIVIEEIHRFVNPQIRLGNTFYWDFPMLFSEIKQGICKTIQKGYKLKGIAVNTWGVDFGLLDKQDRLISNPVCYRDSRTKGILPSVFEQISKERLYRITGNQFLEFNSAFQLFSMIKHEDPQLQITSKLLFMPDLINYFLTGHMYNEYTIASTSQLINAQTRQWEPEVFKALGIPLEWMSPLIQPGTIIGQLRPEIAEETGAGTINVMAVASHDTASAVAAIPVKHKNWAYLSSGTWSLLGIETDWATMTNFALNYHFTNEGGTDGKIRFLRNITGLWLLQGLMAEWEKEDGEMPSYESLLAKTEISKDHIIDPDSPLFVNPSSMQSAIDEYCTQHGLTLLKSRGEYVSTVLKSLAAKYGTVIKQLSKCTGKPIECLYVVGGGSRNEWLNQLTANAIKKAVISASPESTALGNILLQLIAAGEIKNLETGRKILAGSIEMKEYYPQLL